MHNSCCCPSQYRELGPCKWLLSKQDLGDNVFLFFCYGENFYLFPISCLGNAAKCWNPQKVPGQCNLEDLPHFGSIGLDQVPTSKPTIWYFKRLYEILNRTSDFEFSLYLNTNFSELFNRFWNSLWIDTYNLPRVQFYL